MKNNEIRNNNEIRINTSSIIETMRCRLDNERKYKHPQFDRVRWMLNGIMLVTHNAEGLQEFSDEIDAISRELMQAYSE